MERLRQRGGYTKGEAVPLPILSKKGVKTHNSLASIFLRDFNFITTTHNVHYVNKTIKKRLYSFLFILNKLSYLFYESTGFIGFPPIFKTTNSLPRDFWPLLGFPFHWSLFSKSISSFFWRPVLSYRPILTPMSKTRGLRWPLINSSLFRLFLIDIKKLFYKLYI